MPWCPFPSVSAPMSVPSLLTIVGRHMASMRRAFLSPNNIGIRPRPAVITVRMARPDPRHTLDTQNGSRQATGAEQAAASSPPRCQPVTRGCRASRLGRTSESHAKSHRPLMTRTRRSPAEPSIPSAEQTDRLPAILAVILSDLRRLCVEQDSHLRPCENCRRLFTRGHERGSGPADRHQRRCQRK